MRLLGKAGVYRQMNPIMKALKAATAETHERLEAGMRMDEHLATARDYRHLLTAFYGLYQPLETALEPLAHQVLEDWPTRRKVPRLEQDLDKLGLDEHAVSKLPQADVFPITKHEQAFGCLYVLEGATLGGQLITRRLGDLAVPSGFFSSYGSEVGPMWRRFGHQLGAREDLDSTEVVEAANATFSLFDSWFAERLRYDLVS